MPVPPRRTNRSWGRARCKLAIQQKWISGPILHRGGEVRFPGRDGSSVPFGVYSSKEIYDLEQEQNLSRADLELSRARGGTARARRLQEHVRGGHSRGGDADAGRRFCCLGQPLRTPGRDRLPRKSAVMRKATPASTTNGVITRTAISRAFRSVAASRASRACRNHSIPSRTASASCASHPTGGCYSPALAMMLRRSSIILASACCPASTGSFTSRSNFSEQPGNIFMVTGNSTWRMCVTAITPRFSIRFTPPSILSGQIKRRESSATAAICTRAGTCSSRPIRVGHRTIRTSQRSRTS